MKFSKFSFLLILTSIIAILIFTSQEVRAVEINGKDIIQMDFGKAEYLINWYSNPEHLELSGTYQNLTQEVKENIASYVAGVNVGNLMETFNTRVVELFSEYDFDITWDNISVIEKIQVPANYISLYFILSNGNFRK